MRTLYALAATLGRALLTEATLVGRVVLFLPLGFLAVQVGALVAGFEIASGGRTAIGQIARDVFGGSPNAGLRDYGGTR